MKIYLNRLPGTKFRSAMLTKLSPSRSCQRGVDDLECDIAEAVEHVERQPAVEVGYSKTMIYQEKQVLDNAAYGRTHVLATTLILTQHIRLPVLSPVLAVIIKINIVFP